MSLSLRFSALAIGLLLAAVLTVSYLFDQERSAVIDANEREHMRHHLERIADTLTQDLDHLRRDTRFLARTPTLMAIRDALGNSRERMEQAEFIQRYQHIEQLFHAFAKARAEYIQLRLIGIGNGGRELVRVERLGSEMVTVKGGGLPRKDMRHYLQEAEGMQEGQVTLSRIDLNLDHGTIGQQETATIRAISPVIDSSGSPFALVMISLSMDQVFGQMRDFLPASSHMYLANQEGYFLSHPDPQKALTFDGVEPYRLRDEFPAFVAKIRNLQSGNELHFETQSPKGEVSVLVTKRWFNLSPGESREITLIMAESNLTAQSQITMARKKNYLVIVSLMGVAILLVTMLTSRLTRSLRDLVNVSRAVSQGNYTIELPDASAGHDLQNLNAAIRHMINALKQREDQLRHLNQTLEHQVDTRTQELESSRAALAREQHLMQSILDHVGDGVVAVDGDGHFLLWNLRAEEMLGMGPEDIPPQDWPGHYGLYRAPGSDLLAVEELPLVRALKGEIIRSQELFVCNSQTQPGRWISAFARPLTRLSGESEGAVAVLVDLTEARRQQEQLDLQAGELAKIGRLTLIGQIVDTMAHRLSQPLAAIANYAGAAIQLQASNNLDRKRLDEVLSLISRQAERGGECLRDLRSLQLRGGLPHSKLNINAIVESALQLLEDRLQRLNIRIERDFAETLPHLIGQDIELQQAVVHLLMNAMESLSTTEQQPRILRIVTDYQPERNLVRVAVGDNGPGVATELREQIFDAWFTTKPDALGLGLAVAQTISENHNGCVILRDSEDGMTWFLIKLPAGNEAYE
ncbi:MAG: ATP-binding protein [Candidatus Thiodiazotropha sp.]